MADQDRVDVGVNLERRHVALWITKDGETWEIGLSLAEARQLRDILGRAAGVVEAGGDS